jgi:hypothetical protein
LASFILEIMSKAMPEDKNVCAVMFSKTEEACYYTCKNPSCKDKRYKPAIVYTNLMNHLKHVSPENCSGVGIPITSFLYNFDSKSKNIFGSIDWIVNEFRELAIVYKTITRKYTKLNQVSYNTINKRVEENIRNILPEQFGLVIDVWTNDSEHYVAFFQFILSIQKGKL